VAGDGSYAVVESLLESSATDRHAVVSVDESDRARVRFGNGLNGKIPEGSITLSYKTGGGDTGNVDINTITRADQDYPPEAILSVTNPAKASGGAPRQTVESIREEVPRSTRALTRSVAREDFEIHAGKVPGVARSVMLTSNERPAIAENQGQLVVVPEGGGAPSSALKASVLTQVTVTFPHTLTFIVEIIDPTYVAVDVQATVHLFDAANPVTVDAAIRSALTDFFAIRAADGSLNTAIDFGFNLGGELPFSDVQNVVRDINGIRKMGDGPADFLLNELAKDVALESFEFPQLGTIILIDGATGSPLV
jgi:predicted phage baseplate assembly protein